MNEFRSKLKIHDKLLHDPHPKYNMRPTKNKPKSHPLAIAVQTPLLEEIRKTAERMDMTQADTIRLAIKLGMRNLKTINYDLISSITSTEAPARVNDEEARSTTQKK